MKRPTAAECRKAIVAGLGFAAEMISMGVLSGQAAAIAEAVIGLGTALGVYTVPNDPAMARELGR